MSTTKKAFYAYHVLKHIFGLFLVASLTNCIESKNSKDTLIIGIENEIKNFDIRRSKDKNAWNVFLLLSQSLVKVDYYGTLRPSLALSWQAVSPYELRLRLNDKAKFHNGRQVEIADVVFSYQDAMRPHAPLRSLLQSVESYSNPSPNELVIRFKTPQAQPFLANVVPLIRILPRDEAINENSFSSHPVGSGPYRFVSMKNKVLTLERHPDFFPTPKFKTLKIVTKANPNTRLMALAAEEIHLLVNNFPKKHLEKIQSKYDLVFKTAPSRKLNYMGFNLERKSLNSLSLRQFISCTLDINSIVKNKVSINLHKAHSFLPETNMYFQDFEDKNKLRCEKLKKEFDKKLLSAPLVLVTSSLGDQRALSLILQSQLQAAGIKVDIISLDQPSLLERSNRGDFDLLLLTLTAQPDPDFLYFYFHSSQTPPQRNRIRYKNFEADRLLEEGQRLLNSQKRQKIYVKIQEILNDDMPALPLWYSENTILYLRKLKEEILDPNNQIVLDAFY